MFFFYLYIFILEMLCYNMLGNMLKHWKTLQEGWVNALDTLYDLFLIPDNLLCTGKSLNKYNTFPQLRKIESMTSFK